MSDKHVTDEVGCANSVRLVENVGGESGGGGGGEGEGGVGVGQKSLEKEVPSQGVVCA